MIYFDVTAACRLALQTGIPRTTRALHSLIQGMEEEMIPIVWQPFLQSYTELSPRSVALLQDSNAFTRSQTKKPPRDSTMPFVIASLRDLLLERPKRISLDHRIGPQDTLLISSMFPDNRVEFLAAGRGKAGRRVAIFHDAIPLTDSNIEGWARARHEAALSLYAKMDLVICVSEAAETELKQLLKQRRIPAPKTRVLIWPVPFMGFRPAWKEPELDLPTVLYVSRLKNTKNHALLFAACEELWSEGLSFRLELIGCEDVEPESRQILRGIRHLKNSGHPIRWRARVSEFELHEAYRKCAFTVFPSRREGLGLPILESLWHGRPLICSPEKPMSEVGRGPGCILADMRSSKVLANAMRSLLKDPTKNRQMAREAFERPMRSWNEYGRELQPLLHSRMEFPLDA